MLRCVFSSFVCVSSSHRSTAAVADRDSDDDEEGNMERGVSEGSMKKRKKKGRWVDPTPNSSGDHGSNIREGIIIKRKQYNDLKAKYDTKKEILRKLSSTFDLFTSSLHLFS